jgi:hypothetical protein
MPGTDTYQQGYPYPKLSDAPNIETATSALVNAMAPRTNMIFANASARTAALATPVAGMECWLIAEGRKEIYDGTAWRTYPPVGVYADFVPVWTATTDPPVLGNGTLTSRWEKTGKRVTWNGQLTVGSTTNGGTGLWSMSCPVLPASTGMTVRGVASYIKFGVNEHIGVCAIADGGSTLGFVVTQTTTNYTTNVGNATPVATAAGNVLIWSIVYESAS